MIYKSIFVIVVMVGAGLELELVWGIADIFNALMAIPNLIALLFLSGVIVSESNKFREIRKKEKIERQQQAS